MRAFHPDISTERLRSLAVIGMLGAVIIVSVPTFVAARPLPPVESGDPTDVDYGPGPKKAAVFSTLNAPMSAASQTVFAKSRLWSWLSYVITTSWRHSALR